MEIILVEFGVIFFNLVYRLNVRLLLRFVCSLVFGLVIGFIDMLVYYIFCGKEVLLRKVDYIYIGLKDIVIYKLLENCDLFGLFMVNIIKFYFKLDCSVFDVFGRVYSGVF